LTGKVTLRAATFAADGSELAAPRTQVLDASISLSRVGSALATCSRQYPTRLDGSQAQGTRPVYSVDIGNACWMWPHAPLDGVRHVAMTVEQIAWRFGDEARGAVVRPKTGAAGGFEIHADSCKGPLIASLPLVSAVREKGQIQLEANVAMPAGAGARDLCVFVTGDPRDGQWALARMVFSK
jgi:hexosaminidase